MVVEREPARSPEKAIEDHFRPSVPPSSNAQDKLPLQPVFGKPTSLKRNNKSHYNNVFNVPRSRGPRPEHHRQRQRRESANQAKTFGQDKSVQGAPATQSSSPGFHASDKPVEIKKPTNAPIRSTIPQPEQHFTAIIPTAAEFYAAQAKKKTELIDLTTSDPYKGTSSSSTMLYGQSAAAAAQVSPEKTLEDIKNLLEGSIGTDEKPNKPVTLATPQVDVTDSLIDRFNDLKVKHDGIAAYQETSPARFTVPGLAVTLLPHQQEGVQWMVNQERGWHGKKENAPKGGILADDMGLGKTIQSIALIYKNPPPQTRAGTSTEKQVSPQFDRSTLIVAPLALIKQWESEIKTKVHDGQQLRVYVHHGPQRYKRSSDLLHYDVVITTYQILVSEHAPSDEGPSGACFGVNWHRVILDEAHCIKNRKAKATQATWALKAQYRWCLSGTPMQNNLDELQSLIAFLRIKPYNDYGTWKRDITQPINQGQGQTAMKRLQAFLQAVMKRRTKDVLKKHGALGRPLSGNASGPSFKIVARKVECVNVEFGPEERSFYRRLEQSAERSLDLMIEGEKVNYASALVLLLRLRQACNHSDLVKGSLSKDRDALVTDTGASSPRKQSTAGTGLDDMTSLLSGLSVQNKTCDVCQVPLSEKEKSQQMARCRVCESNLASQGLVMCKTPPKPGLWNVKDAIRFGGPSSLEEPAVIEVSSSPPRTNLKREETETEGESLVSSDISSDSDSDSDSYTGNESKVQIVALRESPVSSPAKPHSDPRPSFPGVLSSSASTRIQQSAVLKASAKMKLLLPILQRETPSHKIIVFSQFTSMLDLIEPHLSTASYKFTRYDGSMRNDMREASLERLRHDRRCRVMLCSLKCGSLGLNLTAASRVVILEPFWNPFVEEQAIDRVHRINQTQDVVVYKLTVKDTVEERILALQEKKRALANAAIEGKDKLGKLSLKDLLKLFNRDSDRDAPEASITGQSGMIETSQGTAAPKSFTSNGLSSSGRTASQRQKEHAVYGRRW